jgi:hypothetical protein
MKYNLVLYSFDRLGNNFVALLLFADQDEYPSHVEGRASHLSEDNATPFALSKFQFGPFGKEKNGYSKTKIKMAKN